jgi:hypothetical protein
MEAKRLSRWARSHCVTIVKAFGYINDFKLKPNVIRRLHMGAVNNALQHLAMSAIRFIDASYPDPR